MERAAEAGAVRLRQFPDGELPMGRVLRFERPRTAAARTLCRHGLHRWRLHRATQLDVERGRVTAVLRCTRCAAIRTRLR